MDEKVLTEEDRLGPNFISQQKGKDVSQFSIA
jgi:hypothetical protein